MDYRQKIDYSSLSTYMDCPRKFLFQYILHFRSSKQSIHLVFGSCWHYGLECVYNVLKDDPDIVTVDFATNLSIKSFNKLWQIEGAHRFPDEDIIFPKSPGHAANMYYQYWKQYLKIDQEEKKVLAVESPFTINLSGTIPGLPDYIGRLDLIHRLANGNVEITDHKTAKSLWPTSLTSFEMSFQTDGYLTAGHIYYDSVPSMIYNIALCQKSKIAFHRFYINKRKAQIEQFINDLLYYCQLITHDLSLFDQDLIEFKKWTDNINCFRRCPGYACTLFMSNCPYVRICKLKSNPLLWHNKPPGGYSINEWNPETHEAKIKKQLEELS